MVNSGSDIIKLKFPTTNNVWLSLLIVNLTESRFTLGTWDKVFWPCLREIILTVQSDEGIAAHGGWC